MDIDTFDVMVSSGSSSGSGVDNSSGSGDGGGLASVKVGVFGVCTQHTPSLADPGDKVVFNDGVINDGF